MNSKKIFGIGALVGVVAAAAIVASFGAFGSTSRSAAGPLGGETLRLHGQWTLRIRDHGRIIRTVSFHNDFIAPGKYSLVHFLARDFLVGEWSVGIGNSLCYYSKGGGSCLDVEDGGPCMFLDTTSGALPGEPDDISCSPHNLHVTTDDVNDQLVLTGQITPDASGTISKVFTEVRRCGQPASPLIQCAGQDAVFTLRFLGGQGNPPTVPVVAGQQVLVTVKISVA